MRIAVMSDIHGNLEAFTESLNDIKDQEIDRIVNLGDAIGYGPQPEEVLSLLEEMRIPNILGNHELAVLDKKFRGDFSPQASRSLEQTLKYLTSASMCYLESLPAYREMEGALMVHGCPPDSPSVYLNHMSFSEIRETFMSNGFDTAFVGHTHRMMLMGYDGKDLQFDPLHQEAIRLRSKYRYIVNVGAIGQPRDGDPRAKYMIWDSDWKTLQIRQVNYDVDRVIALMGERGFLRRDAKRLLARDTPR
ncbi:MAG: metallophosphoesterase family protein [Desulfobacteraceae bacterium]|nr:metallophosphoesterase family protein [Desulfobacteraceae bacterium]